MTRVLSILCYAVIHALPPLLGKHFVKTKKTTIGTLCHTTFELTALGCYSPRRNIWKG
eukprot:gene18746-880_t